jgi:peptidoglycan/LPS O-acetylase OafA/YrhL
VRYVPELDGLRAVAVVAVILFHSAPHGPFSGGFVGVDIFFVLSAFLITGILAKQQPLSRFYLHRAIRLVPALLLMLAGYLAAAPFVWPNYNHARDALLTLVYVSDYSYTFWRTPAHLQHTWSLAVEEQFYLMWPFALAALLRTRNPAAWLAAAYLGLTLWRLAFARDWLTYYYRFDTHATGLAAGAVLYFLLPRLVIARRHLVAACAVLGAVLVSGNIATAWIWITPAEVAAAVMIASAVTDGSALLRAPPLVWIGKLSYAMYLWHFPIAHAVRGSLGFAATAAVTLGGSIALAALSYCTVEAAGRRLRDRIERASRVEVRVLGGDPVGG